MCLLFCISFTSSMLSSVVKTPSPRNLFKEDGVSNPKKPLSVPCCISAGSPSHFEKEEREREKNISDTDRGELYLHRRSLSDAKLAALCSEVWPVLALIGGVDTGLRAGGLCQHTPSGRRAVLLGVLKEGSCMAKLQWEETDLSVRYYSFVFVHSKIYFCVCLIDFKAPSTSNNTILSCICVLFACLILSL